MYNRHHPEEPLNIHIFNRPHDNPQIDDVLIGEKKKNIPTLADYVIIGAGPAGLAACKALRECDSNASVVLVGDEASPVEKRHEFSKSLNNTEPQIQDSSFYNGRVVQVEELADGTVKIHLEDGQNVITKKGVLIATGVQPDLKKCPVIPEAGQSQCIPLRSMADYKQMQIKLAQADSVVIYGDGYVACELSATIKKSYPQKSVQILNPKKDLLSSIFPEYMSKYIQRELKSMDIKYKNFEVLKISSSPVGVKLTSTEGKEVECNLLILDIPSSPSPITILGADKQIINMKNGVPCDGNLRVTGKIFTAGDVALPAITGHRIEHYDNAQYSGRIAAFNMGGASLKEYDPNATAFSGNIAGINMTGIGRVDNALSTIGLWESIPNSTENGTKDYKRGAIVYYDDTSRLIKGILLVNLPSDRHLQVKQLLSTALPAEMNSLTRTILSH